MDAIPEFQGTPSVTFTFCPATDGDSIYSRYQLILDNRNHTYKGICCYWRQGKLTAFFGNGSKHILNDNSLSIPEKLELNKWHCIAIVFGATEKKIFVNGDLKVSI